ncbi:hypothetical protein D3C76_1545910 [compost metagenome]
MGAQLPAHQRNARTDEAPQVLAICSNKVRLGRSTKVHYQARAFGQPISPQHRKPAVQPQTLEVFITIAHSTHFPSGLRNKYFKPEALGQ